MAKSPALIGKLDLTAAFNLSPAQAKALQVLRVLSSTYKAHAAVEAGGDLKPALIASLARVNRADLALVNGALPAIRGHVRLIPPNVGKSTYGADVAVAGDTAAVRALVDIVEGAEQALAALKAHRMAGFWPLIAVQGITVAGMDIKSQNQLFDNFISEGVPYSGRIRYGVFGWLAVTTVTPEHRWRQATRQRTTCTLTRLVEALRLTRNLKRYAQALIGQDT